MKTNVQSACSSIARMQDGAYWRKNSASLYFPPSPSPSTATTALSIPDLCPLPLSGPCPPGHCTKTQAPTWWAANKCWHSFLSFTALWSALGDFTLWLCDNVNDQLSLVATSKRSRLQRTFSEGTPLINKEIEIHNQIFVWLDWPTAYPLQVSVASLVPLDLKKQMQIIGIWNMEISSTKLCVSGQCVFYSIKL